MGSVDKGAPYSPRNPKVRNPDGRANGVMEQHSPALDRKRLGSHAQLNNHENERRSETRDQ